MARYGNEFKERAAARLEAVIAQRWKRCGGLERGDRRPQAVRPVHAHALSEADDHRHSGIRYVRPAQRHAGEDCAILQARHALYQHARARVPRRWARHTRNWNPISVVTLNPERDAVIRASIHTHKVPSLPYRRSEVRDAAA